MKALFFLVLLFVLFSGCLTGGELYSKQRQEVLSEVGSIGQEISLSIDSVDYAFKDFGSAGQSYYIQNTVISINNSTRNDLKSLSASAELLKQNVIIKKDEVILLPDTELLSMTSKTMQINPSLIVNEQGIYELRIDLLNEKDEVIASASKFLTLKPS